MESQFIDLAKNIFKKVNFKERPVLSSIIIISSAIVISIPVLLYFEINPVKLVPDIIKNRLHKHELIFSEEEYGIIVCPFVGEKEYKENVSIDLYTTLNQRFRNLNLNNAIAKHSIYVTKYTKIDTPEKAKDLGVKYKADLVIWGSVTKKGILPNIRIISNFEEYKNSKNKNLTIFKDSLRRVREQDKSVNIKYPELTDEPVSLISFAIATRYMENKDFEQAIQYFYKAIPIQKSTLRFGNFLINDSVYTHIALCRFYLGQFNEAEKVLVEKTNYSAHQKILGFIGYLRFLIDNSSGIDSKKFVKVFLELDPTDWRYIDSLYFLGFSQLLSEKNPQPASRQADKIDQQLSALIQDGNKEKTEIIKYYQLSNYATNNNKKAFSSVYNDVFKESDLAGKISLTLMSISIDMNLSKESIKQIKSQYTSNSSITLLDALVNMKMENYEKVKELIESDQSLINNSSLGNFLLATYYMENDDEERAIKFISKLTDLQPDYKEYLETNSRMRMKLYNLIMIAVKKKNFNIINRYFSVLGPPKVFEISFDEILSRLIKGHSVKRGVPYLDDSHVETLTRGFNYINNDELDEARKLFKQNINAEWAQDKPQVVTALYYYCLSFIDILDPLTRQESTHALVLSYIIHPSIETIEEITYLSSRLSNKVKFEVTPDTLITNIDDVNYQRYLGDKIEAENLYTRLSEKFPSLCILKREQGIFYFVNKDHKQAIELLKKAITCNSSIKNTHSKYAELLEDIDCKISILHYKKSLDIDGETVPALNGLSKCYQILGNHEMHRYYFKKYKALYHKNGGNPIDFFFREALREFPPVLISE